jgi:ArsR family transcriptional regulator
VTEIYKALSDESRLRILNLLLQRELCVCEIEAVLSMSQTNVSRHLNKLKSAGIVGYSKKAQWVYYTLNSEFVDQYPYLYQHLKEQLNKEPQFISDLERLNSGKTQAELCAAPKTTLLKEEL